jgi:hypothetical protein
MELRRLASCHELAQRGHDRAPSPRRSRTARPRSPCSSPSSSARPGVPLLRRVGRNVQLTPAGLRVAEHAAGRSTPTRRSAPSCPVWRRAARARARDVRPDARRSRSSPTRSRRSPPRRRTSASRSRRRDRPGARGAALARGGRGRRRRVRPGARPAPPRRRPPRPDRRGGRLALPADHPLAPPSGRSRSRASSRSRWAAGHRGTGHAALIESVCNGLGGYAPDIRHRTDDALILRALVSSGRV